MSDNGLIVVENKDLEELYKTPKGLDPVLDKIKEQVGKFVPDGYTEKGRDEIASFAYKIRRSKTHIEKTGLKLTEKWRLDTKLVNSEKKRVVTELELLIKSTMKPVDDFKNAEKERVDKLEKRLSRVRFLSLVIDEYGTRVPLNQLEYNLRELNENFKIDDSWENFYERASDHIVRTRKILENRIADEKNSIKEKERLREFEVKENERLQKERDEKIARDAKEKAEAEASDKIKQAEKEKQDAIDAQKKSEEKQVEDKKRAEAERIEAENKRERDAIEADKKEKERKEQQEVTRKADIENAKNEERKKLEDARKREKLEAKRREEDLSHRKKINNEAVDCFMECMGLERGVVIEIVKSIAQGRVKNITIRY